MSKKKESPSIKDKAYIGIDYGSKNIGVALGKNGLVFPLKTVDGKNVNSAISELIRIALENKAVSFVLGLPLTVDGRETAQSLQNRHFSKLLKIKSKKKVIFVNEEGTTQEAMESLSSARAKRRGYSDDVAAAIILKRFFQESL